jgi:aspartyl-tRNA(Asn)/glutamyl-tRNA(Gln) amidotransferase subunit A
MTPAEIAARDAAIGAFWHLDPAPRGGGQGPLAGAAVAVKDNIAVAGMPWTAGLAAHRARIAEADSPCIAALRTAGAVILGKTAMDEGALGATGEAPGFPPCRNPLDPSRSPGGSSGGSAAAVAAGFLRMAVGTDTMGSVRIPAAYCGVVGLKPTAGLVGRSGVEPLSDTLDTVGAIAATAEEAGRLLEALVARDEGDPAWRPAPPGWRAAGAALPGALRIGVAQPAAPVACEAAVAAGVAAACARLREAGLTVAEAPMPRWNPGATRRAGLLLAEAEAAARHAALLDDPAAASPAYRAALAYGRDAGATRIVRALQRLALARAAAFAALDSCDALLLPTAPQRAFPRGTPPPPDQADLTALANAAGLPAIAVPVPAADGLPASVQLVGRPHAEALLVALGALLMAR